MRARRREKIEKKADQELTVRSTGFQSHTLAARKHARQKRGKFEQSYRQVRKTDKIELTGLVYDYQHD